MIARQTMKGSYAWRWSITMGEKFSPADSFRFAESSWQPITEVVGGAYHLITSLVQVDDPAIVIFRLARERHRTILWLMNYSDQSKSAELKFPAAFRNARRTDMEGNALKGPEFRTAGKSVTLHLSAWEIAALEMGPNDQPG